MTNEKSKRMNDDIPGATARCWLAIKQYAGKMLAEADIGLTMEQMMALFVLQERDGLNLKALAERTDRERTTTTRMITGLEQKGYVIRVTDNADARHKLIYLTPLGRRQLECTDELRERFEGELLGNIGPEDIAVTIRTLNKVAENSGFGD